MAYQEQEIINKTVDFVKYSLNSAEGGHGWWHAYHVWRMAIRIAKEEKADEFVVQLAALLHDIADSKFHNGNEELGPQMAKGFLRELEVDDEIITQVAAIIEHMSFHKSFESNKYESLEMDVVSDADKLDAIGAIGIARTFNYGGHKGFSIYDPNIKPQQYKSKEEYKKSDAPTINHFYEKLFLLKDMMKTESGKKLAFERHQFMEKYLEQFYKEWEGEL